MTTDWGALNARARGLATHTLPDQELRRLAGLPGPADLLSAIDQRAGSPAAAADMAPRAIELAARRALAVRLRTLARWCGDGSALAVVFEREDRDDLRALVRGALQGIEPSRRLAGLVPTPSLPVRALDELARLDAVHPMRVQLTAWSHPYAADLVWAEGTSPDLRRFEQALAVRWAARASAAARRGGRRLGAAVAELIDLENVLIVTAAVHGDDDGDPDLLPGGLHVTRATVREALAGRDPARAARVLAGALVGTAHGAAVRDGVRRPADLERMLHRSRELALVAQARADPLGPAPFLLCVHRFRREARQLQRLAWGLALGWRGPGLADDAGAAA